MSTIKLNDSLFNNISTICMLIQQDDTDASLYIVSIFLLVNFVVGLPTNVWTVWLICHGTREQLASEIYLLSLAVCEIFYCLGLPAQLSCMFISNHALKKLNPLLKLQMTAVWAGRPIFQSCICIEYYIAVVHPLIFIRLKPLRYKMAQSALFWCVFFLAALIPFGFPNSEIIWFIPIMCTFFCCCFSILCSLKRPSPGEREGEKRRGDTMKRKAFNIILFHMVCFLVNYLPSIMVYYLGKLINISAVVRNLFSSLGVLCGLAQPLLYLHRAGKLSCLKRALT